jgi:hypothetical protein
MFSLYLICSAFFFYYRDMLNTTKCLLYFLLGWSNNFRSSFCSYGISHLLICIPEMNLVSLWSIIFLMCFRVWLFWDFAEVFVLAFTKDFGLQFSFLLLYPFWFCWPWRIWLEKFPSLHLLGYLRKNLYQNKLLETEFKPQKKKKKKNVCMFVLFSVCTV